MDSNMSDSTTRITYSCVRCAERKVKCDRQKPCGACLKHAVECVFRSNKPRRNRHKRAKYDILYDRVNRYEALLQEHGIDLHALPKSTQPNQNQNSHSSEPTDTDVISQLPTPESISSERRQSGDKMQILHSQERSKLVDNTLWTRVVEEFHDPNDALDDSEGLSDIEDSLGDFDFVLGISKQADRKSLHPSPEHSYRLWQVFIENVDPLTKVVHVPSLQPAMRKAANNLASVPSGFEALMFAIYSLSVVSLKDDECRVNFGEPRGILLSRYIAATKAALLQAKFMGTMSIVVLQAVLLHLISIRDRCDSRSLWALTGVALRIAESMGLNRDGASLGLDPFEAEIRRRIWWQLKSHDWRTAEMAGLPKFQGFDMSPSAPKPITNCNDDELYPGMPSPATDADRATDVIFAKLRSVMATKAGRYAASLTERRKDDSLWDDLTKCDSSERDKVMYEMAENLEDHISYCDPSQPLQLITMLTARGAINNVHFMIHHPRRWVGVEHISESEKQLVWNSANKLLELYDMMRSHSQLQRFAWHAGYFMPWYAFIHILDTLRANPLMEEADKSWRLVESVYGNNLDMVSNTNKLVLVGVGNLCLKAFNAREAALAKSGKRVPPAPEYISRLRQQREIAKAKKKAQVATYQDFNDENDLKWSQTDRGMATALANTSLSTTDEHLDRGRQNNPTQHLSSEQLGNLPESDSFWLTDNFDNGLFDAQGDLTAMDTDFILTQDIDFNDTSNESLDWTQWDAWIRMSSSNRGTDLDTRMMVR